MSEKEENVAYYDMLLCFSLNWKKVPGPRGTIKVFPTALLGMVNETDSSGMCILDKYLSLLLENESQIIDDISYIPVSNLSPYCVDQEQQDIDAKTITIMLFPTAHNTVSMKKRSIMTPLGGLHTYKINQPLPISYFKEGKCFPNVTMLEMMIRYDFNYIHNVLCVLAKQAFISYQTNPSFSTVINGVLFNKTIKPDKHKKNIKLDKNDSKIINIEDYLNK